MHTEVFKIGRKHFFFFFLLLLLNKIFFFKIELVIVLKSCFCTSAFYTYFYFFNTFFPLPITNRNHIQKKMCVYIHFEIRQKHFIHTYWFITELHSYLKSFLDPNEGICQLDYSFVSMNQSYASKLTTEEKIPANNLIHFPTTCE